MTSYQAGSTVQGNGILVAPTPELPDGRGPSSDIIPLAAIPVGGELTLLLDTTVWTTPNINDQVALEFTRTQPPPNPLPTDFTSLPRVSLGTVGTRPNKFPVTLPAQHLGEDATPAGPTPIWVRCVLFARGLNPLSSPVMQLFIDRTAPWQAKPVQTGPNPGATPGAKSTPLVAFPNAPTPSTLIDDTWAAMTGNANGLIVKVDLTYPNFQATDRLTLYAAGTRTDPPQVAPIFDAVVPSTGEVPIPIPVLRAVTTGRVQIWFRLTDVADNVSNYSVNYRNVRFLPLPVLGEPVVPAANDGLVDLNDVRAGVTVRVARLPFNTLNELIFTIPWAKLRNEYFSKQIGTDYELPVLVKADLMRGGSSISDSQTTVNTDYSVAGAPYPDDLINPPGEFSPELKQLIVRGQPPVVENTLGPQDVNQTAKIYIDLAPVSGGIWPDPEPGDMVTVKYRGDMGEVVVVSEPLTTGNINTEIELDLPYSIVGPGGLGTQEIWWEVENPNRNNTQKAAETILTVNTVIITLDPPEFVRPPADGTAPEFIICDSLTGTAHVARFRIPPNPHFVLDMDITFNWRGFRTDDYLTPAPADTEFTRIRKISSAELIAGMIFDVGDYDPVIRNVPVPPPASPVPGDFYAGYVKVWYSTPAVPTSGVTEMTVYLLNADFKYCESEPGWDPAP
jgi:hypothetical protein